MRQEIPTISERVRNPWLLCTRLSHTAPQKPYRILLDCNGNNLYRLETLLLVIRNDCSADTRRTLGERPFGLRQHRWRDVLATLYSKEDKDLFFTFELVRITYETFFGPGRLVCEEEGTYSIFHPRAYHDGENVETARTRVWLRGAKERKGLSIQPCFWWDWRRKGLGLLGI